eukprot:4401534-Pleurochrysis_carterae.AAC.3
MSFGLQSAHGCGDDLQGSSSIETGCRQILFVCWAQAVVRGEGMPLLADGEDVRRGTGAVRETRHTDARSRILRHRCNARPLSFARPKRSCRFCSLDHSHTMKASLACR